MSTNPFDAAFSGKPSAALNSNPFDAVFAGASKGYESIAKENPFASVLLPKMPPRMPQAPPSALGAAYSAGGGDPLVSTLQQAGFKGEALKTAWAIAKRESGGRATAYNPDRSTGDDSYGLFQINMLGKMGPSRRAQFGLKRNEDLLDPLTNARAAYKMSHGGTDWGAWGIGPNAYRKMPALDYSGFPGLQTLPYRPSYGGPGASTLPFKIPKGEVDVNRWTGQGTHITDGLDLNAGRKTAVDIMAAPGTAVPAPADGVVLRLGSAQGGDSVYFKDTRGYVWWLGHVDSNYSLPQGTRVRRGEVLTRVSSHHAAPHLHLDRTLAPTNRFG